MIVAPEPYGMGISRKLLDIFTDGRQDPKTLRATRNGPQSQVRKRTGTACFQRLLKQSQHTHKTAKPGQKGQQTGPGLAPQVKISQVEKRHGEVPLGTTQA